MIKLVVSDIDGTLLEDGGHELNPELFEVILKLREKGMQFAAASGRQWASIEQVFDPIKEKIFYLSDNGAYVGCHGRQLFVNPIDRSLVEELVKDIRKAGLTVMAGGPDVAYMENPDPEFEDWILNGYKFQAKSVADVLARKVRRPPENDYFRRYVAGLHGNRREQGSSREAVTGESGDCAGGDHCFWRPVKRY